MEALFEFLPILIAALYYLFTASRRKAARERQKQNREAVEAGGEPRPPSPFEAFMEQMEAAVREANGEAPERAAPERAAPEASVPEAIEVPPTPQPSPGNVGGPLPVSPMPVPMRRPLAGTGAAGRGAEFRPVGSFEREGQFEGASRSARGARSYGPGNPFGEEAFERLPRGRDVTAHDHGPLAKRAARGKTARRPNPWRQRLSTQQAAQEAFVMKEILGGPWRPRRARMGKE